MSPTQSETIDAMLAAAGLDPSPAERETIAEMYAIFKPGIDALHAMPEARYEVPALIFHADPPLQEW
ncbi:hypothetical protein AB0L40_13230 [Patulibacter sp. NPDC049589]|uniref:hypothetical protein n=1 Tax=Patulibacter sp. NPDC049589 TaxID=3154731 RepID=UPI003442CBA2